jgi:hypothetical protein
MQTPKPSAAVQLQCHRDRHKKRRRASTIARSKKATSPMRHMSMWHVDPGTSPCYLEPRYAASHRRSRRRIAYPPPPDQHLCSRRTTSPRPPKSLRIATNARNTPRNWSRWIKRMARRTSFRSEGPNNTRCYQLKDAAQKFSAGVGVELKQIY